MSGVSWVEQEKKAKKLNKVSTLMATALLFSACSADNSTNPDNLQNPPEKTPPTIFQEASNSDENSENNYLKQAKEQVLNVFFQTISSGRQENESKGTFPDAQIHNVLNVESVNVQDLINQSQSIINGGQSTLPIKILWYGGNYSIRDGTTKALTTRMAGELEINNIQIEDINPTNLSDADQASGVKWAGNARLNYFERLHANYYNGLDEGEAETVEKWINTPDLNFFPPFSQWQNTTLDINLSFANGTWNNSILNNERKGNPTNGINFVKDFVIPSDSINSFICVPAAEVCQTIELNLSSLSLQ